MLAALLLGTSAFAAASSDVLDESYSFDVPRQSLDRALSALAQQTRLQIARMGDTVRGDVLVGPLTGTYSVERALRALLDPSRLDFKIVNRRTIAIVPAPKRAVPAPPAKPIRSPVPSDSVESAREPPLQEIIVTAEKRAEILQVVPAAISAFSSERLTRAGIGNTQAMQLVTPGLVYTNTGPNAQPYIRGVGTRLVSAGLESSVATYVDDRYVSRVQAASIGFADIERVEILKGPQGTLYGRNATGGAIRVITKDVSDTPEGYVALGYGNYDYVQLAGAANFPLSDALAVRVSGAKRDRDGFARNIDPRGRARLDDLNNENIRVKVRWDIDDRTTLRAGVNYFGRHDTSGSDAIDISPPGFSLALNDGALTGRSHDRVATQMTSQHSTDEYAVDLQLEMAFEDFTLTSSTVYSSLNQVVVLDADGTNARHTDARSYQKTQSVSQELRLVSDTDGPLVWILGLYGYYEHDDDDESLIDVGLPDGLPTSSGAQDVKVIAAAPYGQATLRLGGPWVLTLGARYSYERKEIDLVATKRDAITTTTGLPFSDHKSWSQLTPKATLEYRMADGLAYATFARGFKSGGYNYPAAGNVVVDPETLDMIELGVKQTLFDNRLRFDASLYHYHHTDLQVTRPISGGAALLQNAADAEVIGLDLAVDWAASEALLISAGLNLLKTEYESYPAAAARVFEGNPGTQIISIDASGKSLLRAPNWSAFLGLQYEFEVGAGRLPMTLSYSYKDDFDFEFIVEPISRPLRQNGYGVLSARVDYFSPSAKWNIAVWGNNLTNTHYFDEVAPIPSGIRGSPGTPRTFGVEVKFSF